MTLLGNGLFAARYYPDALSVQEAEMSMLRRLGAHEEDLLVVQANLATTYEFLGRSEEALGMRQDVYSGNVRLEGEESHEALQAANNYASTLSRLERHEEAKSLLRKMIPVARRVLGESNDITLRVRLNCARALYMNTGATLDDLREAVTTLDETERIARRVLGGTHPTTSAIERSLQNARAAAGPRETPGETPGSFQRASEGKLRTRRIVSVAERYRRSAAEKSPPPDKERSPQDDVESVREAMAAMAPGDA